MTTDTIRKQVRDLKVGEVLAGSGTEVLIAPTAGVRTPTGKVDLKVRWPSGQEKWHTWGKYTEVSVYA